MAVESNHQVSKLDYDFGDQRTITVRVLSAHLREKLL